MLFQLIIKLIRDPTTNHDFCDNLQFSLNS